MQTSRPILVIFAVLLLATGLSFGTLLGMIFSQTIVFRTPASQEISTLSAVGTGDSSGRPDRAKISISIVINASTAEEAGRQTAQIFAQLVKKQEDSGITRESIETTGYQITPIYVFEDKGGRRLVGYEASHSLTVTVSSPKPEELGTKAGLAMDAALEGGANRINGVSFSANDEAMRKLGEEALSKASQQSENKAKTMAGALGLKIIRVRSVTESSYSPITPPPRFFEQGSITKAATELIPGELKVIATVSVTYEVGK